MTDRDKRGTVRRYFRRYGRKIRLRAEPGTAEFDVEVAAAREQMGTRQREPKAYPGPFVYFVLFGSNARVKIGTANDPRKRIKELATGAPGKVRLYYCTPGGRELERSLHALFSEHRINGEWFVYSAAIREWIATDEARRLSEFAGRSR